jgi:hypothetical protein
MKMAGTLGLDLFGPEEILFHQPHDIFEAIRAAYQGTTFLIWHN